MDILEFREKYPEYDHVSDNALNKSLHERYYSDIDYGEFTSRFLFDKGGPVEMEEGSLWGGVEELGKNFIGGWLDLGKHTVGTIDWLIPGEQKALEQAKANISRTGDKFQRTHSGALAWSASVVGRMLPYTMAAIAGGAALGSGAVAAGASAETIAAAKTAGMFMVGFVNMGDAAYDEAKATGATEGQANWERAVVGSITGAIEALQVTRIMKFAGSGKHSLNGFIRTVRNKAWKQAGKGIKSFTADVLKHSIEEGMEEFAQEGVSMAVPATFRGVKPTKEDGTTDWWAVGERLGAAALGGFVAGGFLGSVMMGGNTYTPGQVQDVLTGEYKIDPEEARDYAADYAMKTAPVAEGEDVPSAQEKYLVESLGMTQEQAAAKVAEQQVVKPEIYTGKAYRVETGFKAEGTAADVVRYEQNELGNDLGITEEKLKELENRPASDIIWVTREKTDAARYAQKDVDAEITADDLAAVEEIDVKGGKIISDIGPEGVLVLKKPEPLPEKVKKLSRRDMLAMGHAIPKQLGFSEEERRDWMEQITGKRSMSKMTPTQMRDWVRFMQEHISNYEIHPDDYGTPIIVGDKATTMEAVLNNAKAEIGAMDKKNIPEHVKKGQLTGAKKLMKYAGNLVWGRMNNPMFHLAEILGPTYSKVVGDGLRKGRSIEANQKLGGLDLIRELLEKGEVTRNDLADISESCNSAMYVWQTIQKFRGKSSTTYNVKIGSRTYDMNMSELITIYLWSGQTDGIKMLQGEDGGLTLENTKVGDVDTGKLSNTDIINIRSIVENDPKAMIIANALSAISEEYWAPALNQVSNRTEGRDIADIPNWWGLIVKGDKKLAGKGVKHELNFIEDKTILHERPEGISPLVVRDAFDMFDMFNNAVAEYVGYAEPTRIIRTLLNNKGINKLIKDKGLSEPYKQLTTLFNRAQGNTEKVGAFGHFINRYIRPNVYKAVLVTNPGVIISQATSVANYGAFVDLKYMKHAVKGFWKMKSTLEKSAVARDRYHMAHSNVALAEAIQSDAVLRAITRKSKGILNKLSVGMRLMDLGALSAGMAIAEAEYVAAQDGTMTKGGMSEEYWEGVDTSFKKDSEDAQREIVKRAEYLWEMSQPSWNKWARSELTSHPATNLVLPFRSFHEKSLTIWHRANLDYRRSERTVGDKGRRLQRKAAVLSGYTINTMLRLLVGTLVYGKFKEPEEIAGDFIVGPFAMTPILGRLINQVVRQGFRIVADEGPGYRGEAIEMMTIQALNDALDVVPDITNGLAYLAKGDDTKAEREFKKAVANTWDSFGTLYGIPTNRMKGAYEGWFEEEQEFKGGRRRKVKRKH